jgi:hypothetical protein
MPRSCLVGSSGATIRPDTGTPGSALAGIIIGWIATGIALAATAGLVALVVLAARDPT